MRRAILAIVGTAIALVMLLSFKTHSVSVATPPAAIGNPNPGSTTGSSGGTPSTGGGSAGSGTSGSGSSTASSGTKTGTKTVTGDAANTRYGPVQVQITVTNGKITAAKSVQYPQNTPLDYQINSYAIPVLNQEAVSVSSAHIDMVSGATYTSDGYARSLQSALNKAGL